MLNKTHSKILKNISFYTKIYPSAILENTSLTNVVVAFILNLWNSFFLEHVRLLLWFMDLVTVYHYLGTLIEAKLIGNSQR